MILCGHASQTVSLSYSVIKFLQFQNFTWEGDSLPLWLSPLGELHSLELDLRDQQGTRQADALWQDGMLYGDFYPGKTYSLSLRLEFQPPYQLDYFAADFQSIHPNSYLVALDFPKSRLRRPIVTVKFGDRSWQVPLQTQFKTELEDGAKIELFEDAETYSFQLKKSAFQPFSHRVFPVLKLNEG